MVWWPKIWGHSAKGRLVAKAVALLSQSGPPNLQQFTDSTPS